jgi:group I intron endonuclease
MGFIYRITNRINGKKYIGETTKKDPIKRWEGHLHAIAKGQGCPLLQRAILAHGKENFTFEVITECDDKDRYELEKEYIKSENSLAPNGYNVLEGGPGGGFVGKKHNDETREKMRQATLKKYETLTEEQRKQRAKKAHDTLRERCGGKVTISEEQKEKLRKARIGKKHTEETKKKIKEHLNKLKIANTTLTSEVRKKMSDAAKARPKRVNTVEYCEMHSKTMTAVLGKKVGKYDNKDNLLECYPSKKIAAESNGICVRTIDKSIKSKNPTKEGFYWKLIQSESVIVTTETEPTLTQVDYAKLTVPELRGLCAKRNIKSVSSKRKPELIEILCQCKGEAK